MSLARLFSLCTCAVLARLCFFFFFNDTATTEIYTLSLHDALPILSARLRDRFGDFGTIVVLVGVVRPDGCAELQQIVMSRSEEHTSELQSQSNLVCRLLLEKKTEGQRLPGGRMRRMVCSPGRPGAL